jgi:glycosyltransferase involved in cell wall biosynthesis
MGREGVLLMKKLLVITDMDSIGSGYKHICVPLLTELTKIDEYDIKVIGFMYQGEEHRHPFSVIPGVTIEEVVTMAINLIHLWNPDALIVAMDLPIQARIYAEVEKFKKKYIAITPLENGPLCMSWAVPLFNMDGVFFISQMGTDEAHKVGLTKAEHLQVGVDTVSWHPATSEEKVQLRTGLGIPQDAFVVLTVADNQERKNLWAGLSAIGMLKKEITRPIKYIIVTREQNPYGFKLRDLAVTEGVNQEYTPYERGMPQKDLWALYAVADVYLQPSKAEGLGLPVLDAMCMKIPVVATKTGAMVELLENHRGWLINGEYEFTDVWGNSRRVMISRADIASTLRDMQWALSSEENLSSAHTQILENAYDYVYNRTWDIPARQLHNKIIEVTKDEPKTETPA